MKMKIHVNLYVIISTMIQNNIVKLTCDESLVCHFIVDIDLLSTVSIPVCMLIISRSASHCRYDWYQTESHVIITILLKNITQENLSVDIQRQNVSQVFPELSYPLSSK